MATNVATTTASGPHPQASTTEDEKQKEPAVIRVGTRRSALALKQAELVVAALQAAHPGAVFQVHGMATAGDRDTSSPLPSLGKGLWTSDLEAHLLAGELDVVVHSLKDMPTTLPDGCVLGAVTAREDPRDVVVFPRRRKEGEEEEGGEVAVGTEASGTTTTTTTTVTARRKDAPRRLADLPPGSVVGTSSLRRAAQLRRRYPGLRFADVRGNIYTRMRKMDEPEAFDAPAATAEGEGDGTAAATGGEREGGGGLDVEGAVKKKAQRYDCIILAAAGLLRMGLGDRIAEYLGSPLSGDQLLSGKEATAAAAAHVEERGGEQFPSILYAVGQGALGLELRAGDERVARMVAAVAHARTMIACAAERSVMRTLEGGCSVPIGVETTWLGEGPSEGSGGEQGEEKTARLRLRATVISLDGSEAVDGEMVEEIGSAEEAEELGRRMARDLGARGAQKILDHINKGRKGAGAVKLAEAA